MSGFPPAFADWLALREAADAAARAPELAARVRRHLAGRPRVVIHDFGSGTGSMARWLAPRLPGRQHWVLYDRDAGLLERATADPPGPAADGAAVTVETRQRDVTWLTAADLAGADLVTASALLDLLTAAEVDRVAAACAGAGCAALLALSVTGRVRITPPDPLDADLAEAFNAHQRRTAGDRMLLGPDGAGTAVEAFRRRGTGVLVRDSPWRLGPDDAELAGAWLAGWVTAACELRPELTPQVAAYLSARSAEAAAGRLGVVVQHCDLLAGCR